MSIYVILRKTIGEEWSYVRTAFKKYSDAERYIRATAQAYKKSGWDVELGRDDFRAVDPETGKEVCFWTDATSLDN